MRLTSEFAGVWRTLSMCVLLVPASSIPTSMLTVTLHMQHKSWNEARWICEYQAGSLLSVPSADKQALLESLMQAPPLSSFTPQNVYLGVHNPSGNKTQDAYVWSNCSPLTYTKWAMSQPQASLYKFCGSLTSSFKWQSDYCSEAKPFLCERVGGSCNYDVKANTRAMDTSPFVRQPATVQECQSWCDVATSGVLECWALSFLSTSQTCLLHFGSDVTHFKNNTNLLSDATSTLYVKNCIQVLVDNTSYAVVRHSSMQAYSPCHVPAPGLTATTFTLFQSPVTWFEANVTCANLGQTLYEPRTANVTFESELGFTFSADVWLGLENCHGAGYRWSDGQPPGDYDLWATGSPPSSNGCAYRQQTSGQWATAVCDSTRPFMCQRSKGQCFFESVEETRGTVYTDKGWDLLCFRHCEFLTDCVGYSTKIGLLAECRVHYSSDKALLYNPANVETGQVSWTMYRPRCAYAVTFPGLPQSPEAFPLVEGVEVNVSSPIASQSTVDTVSASLVTSPGQLSTGEATTMQSPYQTTFTAMTSTGIQVLTSSLQSLAELSSKAQASAIPSILPSPAQTQASSFQPSHPQSSDATSSSLILSGHSSAPTSDISINPADTTGLLAHSESTVHSTTVPEVLTSATILHLQSTATETLPPTTQGTTIPVQSSFCSCRCSHRVASQPSLITSLVSELTVPKNSTRQSRSKLVSAPDPRPSARGMGYVAVVVLVLVLALLLVPDLLRVAQRLCK